MGKSQDILTHGECCEIIEESLERAINTLQYVKKVLEAKPKSSFDKTRASRYLWIKDILCNINYYGAYLHGAQMMLLRLHEHLLLEEPHSGDARKVTAEDKILNKAQIDLIASSHRNIELFLGEEHEVRFDNHERDKKGKLLKCRAYFAKRVSVYKEVK